MAQKLAAELAEALLRVVADELEDLLNLTDVDDLLGGVGYGPVFEQPNDQVNAEASILVDEILHARHQLGIEVLQATHLVKRYQDFLGEVSVLDLEWRPVARDDCGQDLEELGDAIMLLLLVSYQ